MPSTAASAVIPPPTITYVSLRILFTGLRLTAIYAVITDDRLVHLSRASIRARASDRRDRVAGRTGPEGSLLLRRAPAPRRGPGRGGARAAHLASPRRVPSR